MSPIRLGLLLLLAACAPRADVTTRSVDSTGAVVAVRPTGAPAAAPSVWTAAQACDSAAGIARRSLPKAVVTTDEDSLRIGNQPSRPACRVTIAVAAPPSGESPLSFEGGIGGAGWADVVELLADGEDMHIFGLHRPEVVCKIDEGTSGSNTFTITIRCSAEGVEVAPLAAPELPDLVLDQPVKVVRNGEDACYHYPAYTIAANELDSTLGSDFFIRSGPDGPCAFDSLPGDLVIRNQWAEYYLGLSGTTLLLDSGTGTKRGLLFYDLRSGKKYFEGGYNDLSGGGPPGTLGTWEDSDLDPASSGCRPGSQVIVEQLTWVTIATGETRPSGYLRCGFTE